MESNATSVPFRLTAVGGLRFGGTFVCPTCGSEISSEWGREACWRAKKVPVFCLKCDKGFNVDLDDAILREINLEKDKASEGFTLTLRRYYAAAAMEGILSNPEMTKVVQENYKIFVTDMDKEIATWAFKLADAMIVAEKER